MITTINANLLQTIIAAQTKAKVKPGLPQSMPVPFLQASVDSFGWHSDSGQEVTDSPSSAYDLDGDLITDPYLVGEFCYENAGLPANEVYEIRFGNFLVSISERTIMQHWISDLSWSQVVATDWENFSLANYYISKDGYFVRYDDE